MDGFYCFYLAARLEAEHLIRKLARRPRLLVAQRLRRLLHRADHRRGPTHQDLHVRRRLRQALRDHVARHEAHAARPLRRWVVQHVVHPELAVLRRQAVEILAQQDILLIHIRVDQIHLGAIPAVPAPQDRLDDLQHRRDACAARDHPDVPAHVRRVDHGALGALDAHRVADPERVDVLRDAAGGVRLNHEVEVAAVDVVGGDGRVGARDLLLLAGDERRERDVLADREAEDVGFRGEPEAVAVTHRQHPPIRSGRDTGNAHGGIVRRLPLLRQREILERVRIQHAASDAQLLRHLHRRSLSLVRCLLRCGARQARAAREDAVKGPYRCAANGEGQEVRLQDEGDTDEGEGGNEREDLVCEGRHGAVRRKREGEQDLKRANDSLPA